MIKTLVIFCSLFFSIQIEKLYSDLIISEFMANNDGNLLDEDNVFKYITFRTGLSLFTSLIIVLLIGGPFIRFFSNRKIVNPIRDDGPQDHM